MNLPRYSLDNTKIIYFFLVILLFGGVLSFGSLEKKEDSPFVIKSATLITRYPGATPQEVEQLITEPIEREIQSMSNVQKITSNSYYGLSKISISLDPATPPDEIPQMWDELRRKALNIQPQLPQGSSSITVADDFGDVFGIYYGLTADKGFDYAELRKWAQEIKKEVVPIKGVQKVTLFGEQTEVVNVLVSSSKLANLKIDPNAIIQLLQSQNKLINTGEKSAEGVLIKVMESGTYKTLEDISNQIITSRTGEQIRLGDFATIEKGYMEPPNTLIRVNGKPAISIGVSTAKGVDVVKTGDLVQAKLKEIEKRIPHGIELVELYPENTIAKEANNGFIINLIESVAIVIFIIMIVMGMRAGILIGSSLIFSIGGTLLIMQFLGVGLNRTSLAGFIIAMGMLVDNAIVVTDNAQIAMARGTKRKDALINGAIIPQWGLLGATLIAICSFLPLYLAPSSVAEIVKPLFVVLAISLGLSWILALSQTPVFGNFILKEPKQDAIGKDPYEKKFYKSFTNILSKLIKFRWVTLFSVIFLFISSLIVMGIMPSNFFPNLDKPYFRVDAFMPEGYDIKEVEKDALKIEKYLMSQPRVKNVSISLGSSPPRYYLASNSYGPMSNYANFLVELKDKKDTKELEEKLNKYIIANFPNILCKSSLFKLSPAVDAAIEIGFIGENTDTLNMLTEQVMAIMRKCDKVGDVRNSWGTKIPIFEPVYSQEKGQRLGITRAQMAQGMTIYTKGFGLGEFREGDLFMPILLKDANGLENNLNNLRTIPIFNNKGEMVPLEQVVERLDYKYDYNGIYRYNREKVMKAQCDPLRGSNTKEAFNEISSQLDKIRIPQGYKMKVFGEAESQTESNEALAANMPLTFILIFITLLLLFKAYKKPVVILLMIPLIFIGVVIGLLATGKMFDFFAMLGLLGLVGMIIKNAIVLVDQIGIEKNNGLSDFDSVVVATRSRIIPVSMAAGTTILGMLPLLGDSMFGGMAATIMGGLLVGTFLTILVLPVMYCIFFKIKSE